MRFSFMKALRPKKIESKRTVLRITSFMGAIINGSSRFQVNLSRRSCLKLICFTTSPLIRSSRNEINLLPSSFLKTDKIDQEKEKGINDRQAPCIFYRKLVA